jgi:hypothetical protein
MMAHHTGIVSLSAQWGERAGVRWACSESAHLTLPLRGPLPLPPLGGEGNSVVARNA